ncbi:unnamed protein product [Owenia fusiformis]|uniref:Beta-1,3-galactosyl-O-glycosyl-glycoprotein beta-1,6-N-acetylglucosaminyltransferase n=1 Tax=Owenia fusiformis TaxID=6347 RepID=A0A8S4N414_OWEFU|nr:unnamed protein product [Owenia fusiformis]
MLNVDDDLDNKHKGVIDREHRGDSAQIDDRLEEIYRRLNHTDPVDCAQIINKDEDAITHAQNYMREHKQAIISDNVFVELTQNCEIFKTRRGYHTKPLSAIENKFPVAFQIAMYRDVEQVERLLRAIYFPQNLYCIHVEMMSHEAYIAISSIAACFPNVFLSSKRTKVVWGAFGNLELYLNCMSDLVMFYRGRWKYFINLTGQEFPLKTNAEIVAILRTLNGTNDIAGSESAAKGLTYRWNFLWDENRHMQPIPKQPPPHNLVMHKGTVYGVFSRRFVEFLMEDEVAQDFLDWCKTTANPDEHFFNTLNHNPHINAPGQFEGTSFQEDAHRPNSISKAVIWGDNKNRHCYGKFVRTVCIYGIKDLPFLVQSPYLFANKFDYSFEPVGYTCLERHMLKKTLNPELSNLDMSHYENLLNVQLGRHNGI